MATIEYGLEFPQELCVIPQSLVGVAGLDTLNNAVHRIIWEALINSRRQDRSPVHFKLLGPVHEFPTAKPKRNTYEWYIPKGILKRNWMAKHLRELPAVIIIFYDMDWDDPDWPEKKIECTSRVQSIRAALEGRNTRLGVVLIQQKAPLPTGEDMQAMERAAALCAASDINPKCLFVLPHGDHLSGYVLRLENAFYELAQSYYQQEIRHIKSHREHLNKTTHQYLFVRHQFKMAFLSELKNDNRTAHIHYAQAYTNLLELRVVETNVFEIKTVAGFIVYKLCRLLFAMNQPRDAINQFRTHIDEFKPKVGPKDLAFQHHAWLSKQFSMFGEVFQEAIRLGLPAVQTMHPGYYYEQAAKHAVDRKLSAVELCQGVDKYPENDPLSGWESMEFYGQRPWRAGILSAQPPDLVREKEGFIALKYNEKFKVSHSTIIIGLLGSAITEFKTYRCPRMRRHLVIQMADEYYSSKDYGKALTLLSHMLWDYRSEAWSRLLSSLLSRALCCAYLTASINDYIDIALEACAKFSHTRQIQVLDNLLAVIEGKIPEPEPGVPEDDIPASVALWKSKAEMSKSPHTVDMNNITSCIECKARFTQALCNLVEMQVLIKCTFPRSIQFSRLSVSVNNPTMSSEFAVCGDKDSGDPKLLFEPGEVKSFLCQFTPDPRDAGKEIQIGSILLELNSGGDSGKRIMLRFTGNSCDAANTHPELQHFRHCPAGSLEFNRFIPRVSITLGYPTPLLQVNMSHEAPALEGAWHRITAELHNPESAPVTQVTLHVAIKPTSEEAAIEETTELCETVAAGLLSLPLSLSVGEIPSNSSVRKSFYMRAHTLPTRHLVITVSYVSSTGEQCAKEVNLSINVEKAIDVTTAFLSLRMEPISKLYVHEPFVIRPQVDCLSPCPVVIHETELQLPDEVSTECGEYQCQMSGVTLQQGEGATSVACLVVKTYTEQPLALGSFVIHWSRDGENNEISTLHIALPVMRMNTSPLHLEMSIPAHGWVRTPLPIAYILHNKTQTLLSISLNMEPSDAFMFAGHKQVQMQVLPESHRRLEYNLYPLLSGLVALPKLKLTVSPDIVTQQQITEFIDRVLPSHVYIMPQAKNRTVETTSLTDLNKSLIQ